MTAARQRGLPDGLPIAPATGLLSGTPTTTGAFPASVTIGNSAAETRTPSFTWTVPALGGDHLVTPDRFARDTGSAGRGGTARRQARRTAASTPSVSRGHGPPSPSDGQPGHAR